MQNYDYYLLEFVKYSVADDERDSSSDNQKDGACQEIEISWCIFSLHLLKKCKLYVSVTVKCC